MDSRYKLGKIEDIVAEMEELFDIPDELVEGMKNTRLSVVAGGYIFLHWIYACMKGLFWYMTKVSRSLCRTFPSH